MISGQSDPVVSPFQFAVLLSHTDLDGQHRLASDVPYPLMAGSANFRVFSWAPPFLLARAL